MPATFLSLPRKVRREIYKYLLVHDGPIQPGRQRTQGLAPSILSTNSTILREGRAFLYGRNTFDLASGKPKTEYAFLNRIGSSNASHIRSIRIRFPVALCNAGTNSISEYSVKMLETIVSYCTRLESVTMAERYARFLSHHKYVKPKGSNDHISIVDSYFKRIPSLTEIIIESYRNVTTPGMLDKLDSHDWVVRVVQRERDP